MLEFIWAPSTVDFGFAFVIALCVGAIVLLVWRARASRVQSGRWPDDLAKDVFAVFLAGVTVYVAYASMRNQLRLAAEASINDEGNNIFDKEMADQNLRCVYGNFAFDDPAACLTVNTKDAASWSKIEFYVEEALWTLHKAGKDRAAWQSHYDDDIEYWAQDVEQDPTGLFSYYTVARYGVRGGKKYLSDAHICIPNLCERYTRVYDFLSTRDRNFTAKNSNKCQAGDLSARDLTMDSCAPRPLQ